jgi:hypothetical protein
MRSSPVRFASLLSFALLLSPSTAVCLAQKPVLIELQVTTFAIPAGDLKVADLIDRAAGFLQWNILFHDAELAQGNSSPLKLQQAISTDRQGCEDLLSSLLYQRGFVILPLDEPRHLYEVVSLTGPRSREVTNRAVARTPEQVLARPTLRMPVTVVVSLKHINAIVATNALRPFFASAGPTASLTIGNAGNAGALILTGLQDQVATAVKLVQTVDVPPPPEAAPTPTERLEQLEARLARIEKLLEKAAEKPTEKR